MICISNIVNSGAVSNEISRIYRKAPMLVFMV